MGGRLRQIWFMASKDQRATTAIEYALIGATLALVIAVGFESVAGGLSGLFELVREAFLTMP